MTADHVGTGKACLGVGKRLLRGVPYVTENKMAEVLFASHITSPPEARNMSGWQHLASQWLLVATLFGWGSTNVHGCTTPRLHQSQLRK